MKKIITIISAASIVALFFSFNIFHSGGEIGRTGSPGEGNCSGCHGAAAGTSISITAIPGFTNNVFDPSTTYTITITVNHATQPAFGFNCEVLGQGNTDAGVISNGGAGVQFATTNGRKNATHTAPKTGTGSASWTFQWVPPLSSLTATIFAAGNAVNQDGNTGGDVTSSQILSLTNLATGIALNTKETVSRVMLYPNPSNDRTILSYNLNSDQKILIELIEVTGKIIKTFVNEEQTAGQHSNLLDLKGIASGVYFVKTSAKGERISQKLISIQ